MQKASRGEYVEPAKIPTFAELAEDWYQSKTDRRPSHVSDLRTRLDKHILPIFGTYKLDRITVAAVEKFRNDLRDRGYARRCYLSAIRNRPAELKTYARLAWALLPASVTRVLSPMFSPRLRRGLSGPPLLEERPL
jgi:hypothetical protein